MSNRYLIVAVEVKVRDYYSRLLIINEALNGGFKVIFGSERTLSIHKDKLPKGIYLDKSISLNKKDQFQTLIDNGIKVVSIDEEGLASQNNHFKYITQRVSEETLAQASLVFTWGSSEARIITEEYPHFASKIKNTGNPRVDLLKPYWSNKLFGSQVRQIKQKYGNYILFPSNFTINHALGKGGSLELLRNIGRIKNQEDQNHYSEKLGYFERMFAHFVDIVQAVASEFPEVNVLVRPHPSEDPAFWRILSKKYKNLHIQDGGVPTPWLMGADLVVHSSCTTGLEASLLGTKTIAYLPDTSHEYAKHISNDFSVKCFEKAKVLNIIQRYFNGKDWSDIGIHVDKNLYEKHLANYFEDSNASRDILDEIKKLDSIYCTEEMQEIKVGWKQRFYKTLTKFKVKPSRDYYYNRKFPGLSKKELLTDLAKILDTDTFKKVHIKKKGWGVFEISRK